MKVRRGNDSDVDAMLTLEQTAFPRNRYHQISHRSMRHFMRCATAAVIIAEWRGHFAGGAIALFRAGSTVARLYSISVMPKYRSHGIGAQLLCSSERAAKRRRCTTIRLEVRTDDRSSIRFYRMRGYRQFGRHIGYYPDGVDALRFEKSLVSLAMVRKPRARQHECGNRRRSATTGPKHSMR